jgi:oxygen-dependent protoporphyrinogen oxidase
VIGGGISGLAAAHRVVELDPTIDVRLWEAAPRAGGVLHTVRKDGFLLEKSADNFLTTHPSAVALCHRLGLSDRLLPTTAAHRRALVVRKGRLLEIPDGFMIMAPRRLWPLLTTRVLSWRGKLRLLAERLVPRRTDPNDESLASFATRRLGREAYERIVQPLTSGIYAANPEKLSMQSALPQFVEMERCHGSLTRAALAEPSVSAGGQSAGSGARYSLFVAPRDGMESLVTALVERLPTGTVITGSPVERLELCDERWIIQSRGGTIAGDCDAVIVAAPAASASRLLQGVNRSLAQRLAEIEHTSCAVVSLGYRRDQFAALPAGFGIVVPSIERRPILAASFASLKYPGRAPQGAELVRVFFGGANQPSLVELPDEELVASAHKELVELTGVRGEPLLSDITKWPEVMPQYHVGHSERLARIDSLVAKLPGLQLAGKAYRGVGVPQCIQSGEEAADRTVCYLAHKRESLAKPD